MIKARQVSKAYRETRAAAGGSALGGEFVEALETVLSRTRMPPRLVQVALSEAAVFHYGLLAWGRRRDYAGGVEAFSYHIKNGYGVLVAGLVLVLLIEATLVHLALLPRVPVLAWILAILSVYGILFFVADFKAAVRRPVLLDDEYLHVRTALRWRSSIPISWIESVEVSSKDIDDKQGLLDAKVIGAHNVVVRLHRRVVATGLYGITKRFDRLALSLDEPGSFTQAVARRRQAKRSLSPSTREDS